MKGRGFHWFVAMRYLRGRQFDPPKDKLSTVEVVGSAFAIAVAVLLSSAVLGRRFIAQTIRHGSAALRVLALASAVALFFALVARYVVLDAPATPNPFRPVNPWLQRTELAAVIAGACTVLFATLTILRKVFSFFSTVSIAGVWIGTMALVFVLSVMSGFESDLRSKILGSNAHIQVSREDGDFAEWEDVKQRVEHVPGVVSSTPFAVSEVVIAANNNYFNVIIKGIDPASIEKVTQLVDDIQCEDDRGEDRKCTVKEARDVIARLEPLVDDADQRVVPQSGGSGSGSGKVMDQAPADMVDGTDPIDFSKPDEPEEPDDADKPGSGSGSGSGSGAAAPSTFGGDAPGVLGLDAEPAPRDPDDTAPRDDLDAPPRPRGGVDLGLGGPRNTHTITVSSSEFSPPSRRTRSLPGVLVGKELTKQIHLYPDQEVRMVSPLSDPANPDATGTPIPFNRDYRVAGKFFTGMYEYDLKFVYVTLDSLQDFLDRGDVIDGLEVRIDDPDAADVVVGRLQHALGPTYRVQDWQELNKSLFSALKLEKIAMFLVLAIIILVASFSIVGNLVMVVVEKGKEIALLKTLGASDQGVTWIFVTQGFFIGLIGTALGVAYGLLGCVLAKRFGIPINPDVYYIDRLPIHVDLPSVGLIAAAGVLISVGATLYPAFVASRLAPSVGLRH